MVPKAAHSLPPQIILRRVSWFILAEHGHSISSGPHEALDRPQKFLWCTPHPSTFHLPTIAPLATTSRQKTTMLGALRTNSNAKLPRSTRNYLNLISEKFLSPEPPRPQVFSPRGHLPELADGCWWPGVRNVLVHCKRFDLQQINGPNNHYKATSECVSRVFETQKVLRHKNPPPAPDSLQLLRSASVQNRTLRTHPTTLSSWIYFSCLGVSKSIIFTKQVRTL